MPTPSNDFTFWHCPICPPGAKGTHLLIEYAVGKQPKGRIDLRSCINTGQAYCPHCLQAGRKGLHGEIGLVAVKVGRTWSILAPTK